MAIFLTWRRTYSQICGMEIVNVGWLDLGNSFFVGDSPRTSRGPLAGVIQKPKTLPFSTPFFSCRAPRVHAATQSFTWTIQALLAITISDQGDQTNLDSDVVYGRR